MRVVVADDSVLLREGVVRLLEEWGYEVVAQAGDADDLLRKVTRTVPTSRSSTSACRPRTPTTGCAPPARSARSIRRPACSCSRSTSRRATPSSSWGRAPAGVGYLLKDRVADVERFIDSVERVADGGSALDPEVVSQLVGRARRDDPLDELTPREREVLALMAEGRSNQAIAEHMVVTERAVEKHVTSIFSKLDLTPAPEDHRRVLAVLAFLRA